MSVTSQHLGEADDLESTAELPVLEELVADRAGGDLTLSMPMVADDPGLPHLDMELQSLGANLDELKQRLDERDTRLHALQVELAGEQAAAARAGALQVELTGARTANLLYAARVRELEALVRDRDASLQQASERETGLRAELARKDQDAQVLLAQRETQLRMDSGRQEAASARLHHDLEQMRTRCAAQHESLQLLEARRGFFEAQLQELERQLQSREQKVGQLATVVDHGNTQAGELRLELESRGLRISALEAELSKLSALMSTSAQEAGARDRENEELRAAVRTLTDQAATHAAHLTRLEQESVARLQAQADSHHAVADAYRALERAHAQLREQHVSALAELQLLREQTDEHVVAVQEVASQHAGRLAQIAAGEARVRELAAQLASRDHDVGEMTQTITDLKSQLEQAHKSLGERDSLMQRLETEAVHSQALVDNIRRSLRQLAPTPGTATTGTQESLEDVRLLVRVENGQEIPHVLGRRTAIGRTSDNDLQIDASYISRHHALIMTSATHAVIEDLGSTNGVHVNGRKVARQLLKDGDAVLVGRMLFRYVVQPPPNPKDQPQEG